MNGKTIWTYELVKDFLNILGYELISKEYITSQHKLILRDKDGYFYYTKLNDLQTGYIPNKFDKSNPFTIDNIKLWLYLNNLPFQLISEDYISSKQNIVLRDNNGYYYEIRFSIFQNNFKKRFNIVTSKKYALQNIKLWLKLNNKPYELLSKEFISANKPLILADKNNYYYSITWTHLQTGRNQPFVYISNPFTIKNIKIWTKVNNKPFELISEDYVASNEKLKWQCLNEGCEEVFNATWNEIQQNKCCGYCTGKQVGLSNCLATKFPEIAKEWHPTRNRSFSPYDFTSKSEQFIWWKCKECSYEWETRICTRTSSNSGCPECNESKGEKKLEEILTQNRIPHSSQYTFFNLIGIGGGLLKFDKVVFWDKNKTRIRMLIEFDGEQHYKWIKGLMSEKKFKTLQIHDHMKNEYCEKHNIKLLRIPYWDFDNIEKILGKELFTNEVVVNGLV